MIASTLIELTPGPNMTWLAVLGANRGRMIALSAVAGICLGLAISGAVAAFGLTTLLNQSPFLFEGLRWLGTLYLFYLAWDAWKGAEDTQPAANEGAARAFQQGFITNILNPKAYLFYAAILPQFVTGTMLGDLEIAMLTAVYVAIATVIHSGIALLAGTVATRLHSSPKAILFRKILALLIAAAAIWFFISTKVIQ